MLLHGLVAALCSMLLCSPCDYLFVALVYFLIKYIPYFTTPAPIGYRVVYQVLGQMKEW